MHLVIYDDVVRISKCIHLRCLHWMKACQTGLFNNCSCQICHGIGQCMKLAHTTIYVMMLQQSKSTLQQVCFKVANVMSCYIIACTKTQKPASLMKAKWHQVQFYRPGRCPGVNHEPRTAHLTGPPEMIRQTYLPHQAGCHIHQPSCLWYTTWPVQQSTCYIL